MALGLGGLGPRPAPAAPGHESERSFLRDTALFFAHLFSGVLGLAPSSFHRRVRKLRRFFGPLRRAVLPELVGGPAT